MPFSFSSRFDGGSQVLQPMGRVEGLQFALRGAGHSLELTHETVGEQFPGMPVAEGLNHILKMYTESRYTLNPAFRQADRQANDTQPPIDDRMP